MTTRHFVVDTNVLLVARLDMHADHPARAASIEFLDTLAATPEWKLLVDFVAAGETATRPFFGPNFLQSVAFCDGRSRILSEYQNKLPFEDRALEIMRAKVESRDQCRVMLVNYDGLYAILDSTIKSTIDRSDRKFVMTAANYLRNDAMGWRFPPTIVYSADLDDWRACRSELERYHRIDFLQLGADAMPVD